MTQASLTRRLFSAMGRFIDALRVILGRLVFLLLLVIVLLLVFSGPDELEIPADSTLVLAPRGSIVEQRSIADPVSLMLGLNVAASTSLQDIVAVVDAAAADDRIVRLILELDELVAISPVHIETIGAALERFRATGKTILAYGDAYSQAQYALASHADEITMHPMGNLLLPGYGGNQLFFAGLMERLKVNVHVFRAGTHKAAAEPFTRSDLSPEARENNQQLVDELWARYLGGIAENRSLDMPQLMEYTDNFSGLLQQAGNNMADLALQRGLIDSLERRQEFYAAIEPDNRRRIGASRYLAMARTPAQGAVDSVGVITAQGTIILGEQQPGMIGSDSLVSLIRRARRDENTKALVLRIDSPGGVATASEYIREELQRVRDAGKPVVVSMGSTAASGGYWIATAADRIWASPASVTGSIGVIGMVPSFEESLEGIGITTDGVGTTPLSRGGDLLSGLNPAMAEILQANVDDGYRRFLELVAEARGMTVEQVDAVAQGKVWSGERARQLGLVDELGDLNEAVAAAAELAGLETWQSRDIEEPLTPAEAFLQQLALELDGGAILNTLAGFDARELLGETGDMVRQLSSGLRLDSLVDGRLQMFSLCEFCLGLE